MESGIGATTPGSAGLFLSHWYWKALNMLVRHVILQKEGKKNAECGTCTAKKFERLPPFWSITALPQPAIDGINGPCRKNGERRDDEEAHNQSGNLWFAS
jgi:hypothetical protein